MRSYKRYTVAVSAAVSLLTAMIPLTSSADNPIVQTMYTADGAPMVYNDTLYMYTGHDEGNSGFYSMNDWRCFSTTDMQNWTDLGVPLTYKMFSWSTGEAWAAQCVERDGKFYYYVTVTAKTGGHAIGVAVADSPEGPYTDPIGKPLAGPNWSYIDPTVFIDDDGQAYLYWGNGGLWYVKLNKDMISYQGSPIAVDVKSGAFGQAYTEAPYLYKHGDWYYMVYAADGVPENIAYSMSKSPQVRGSTRASSCRRAATASRITRVLSTTRAVRISPTTLALSRRAAASSVRCALRSSSTIPTAR